MRVGLLGLDRFVLADSRLAADALCECTETLTPSMRNHSLRTFVFGLALANLDGVRLDVEHLYVASLLHDLALETPTPARCFAVAGAVRLPRTGFFAPCRYRTRQFRRHRRESTRERAASFSGARCDFPGR